MVSARDGVRPSIRPPHGLFAILAVIAIASAATFAWAGWEMLRQDRAAEEQRERERLESRADRAVQALERILSGVDEHLAARAAAPVAALPDAPADGVVLVFDRQQIHPVAPATLAFYPFLQTRAEAPASLFIEAEADEFQRGALPQAVDAYRRLARSPDRIVRAASLMRLGRVLRQLNRDEDALAVYGEMAALDDVPVVGLPAGVIGRDAQMRLLDHLGRREDAEKTARSLQHDLMTGRWRLTSGQFDHYAANAARISGHDAAGGETLAAARAVAEFWVTWQATPTPRGRALVGDADGRQLIAWRGIDGGFAAWITNPDRLLARLAPDTRQDVVIGDANSAVVAGTRRTAPMTVVRTIAETGLPFNVQAISSGTGTQAGVLTRGRLVVLGLAVMLAFLLTGAYFIGRAVKQETALAQLQADFVSAVSHEFRTPLASMRQLSELLASGRVPLESRRQQYYESLAGESRRLQRLVENLLEFGKLEAGARPYQIEPTDPRALVEAAVEEFRSQLARSDCRIELSGAETALTHVLADRDALTLALHNLLDNAVKYSGGRPVRVRCEPEGDRIAFSIRDEGPGIAVEDRSRIFQKFVRGASAVTANVKRTGVGLAMVQLIVTGHGGEIRLESELDSGSTFTLLLPAQAH